MARRIPVPVYGSNILRSSACLSASLTRPGCTFTSSSGAMTQSRLCGFGVLTSVWISTSLIILDLHWWRVQSCSSAWVSVWNGQQRIAVEVAAQPCSKAVIHSLWKSSGCFLWMTIPSLSWSRSCGTQRLLQEKCSAMRKLWTQKMNGVSKPVATIQNQRWTVKPLPPDAFSSKT